MEEEKITTENQEEYSVKLTKEEQEQVNEQVDHFKRNVALDGDRLEDLLRKAGVDTDRVKALNERVDKYKPSKNYADNTERFRNGIENGGVCQTPSEQNQQNEDIRHELDSLKEAVKDLTAIIKEKM